MANILVLNAKVPYTSGGAEALSKSLVSELKRRGHLVDTVELPFSVSPKHEILNQAAIWRMLDLSAFGDQEVDLVIATKFPTYYIKHPRKSLWLVHQQRAFYDLYGSRFSDVSDDPRDEALRQKISIADRQVIAECKYISGISKNVVERLDTYHGIKGQVLYPPLPHGSKYYSAASQNYVLYVGRICNIKRIDLMLKAMPMVQSFMNFKIVGVADEPGVMDYFKNEMDKHNLWHRIEFLGRVSDEELLKLYAEAFAVYYAPFNEDYGYVTLEAFASKKPVITCNDSGGVLEFVRNGENGVITDPSIDAVGHALNRLIDNRELALQMGQNGYNLTQTMGLFDGGWDKVVSGLLSPLDSEAVK